jgi:long-chain acyl-CoA synthetase
VGPAPGLGGQADGGRTGEGDRRGGFRGGNNDRSYHGDQAKRRAADRDGLFAPGDIGYFDEQGYLYLCDRKIDMIISGGVNIYPAQIEAKLQKLPAVADCAVFGIAGFSVPKRVEFRAEFPREDSGRMFKRKLRDPFWAEAGRSI